MLFRLFRPSLLPFLSRYIAPPLQSHHFYSTEVREESKARRPAAVPVELDPNDIEECFIRGSGNGGQKINKTASCVQLKHLPTGIMVKCQETRSRDQNRKIARRRLIALLDQEINGVLSKPALKQAKLRKQKAKQRKRTSLKYQGETEVDSTVNE